LHIRLTNIPTTSTVADIRRMLKNHHVENIATVELDYHRFLPSAKAYLTVTHPDFLHSTLKRLTDATLCAHVVKAEMTPAPVKPRVRGSKGREDATGRAVVTGNGVGAGITDNEKSVLLYGLPGKLTIDATRSLLKGYKLAGGRAEIAKLDPSYPSSLTSRILVRLANKSEAYRLVRNMHMTYFDPGVWKESYLTRARVIV
ncbi:hypothetical protein BV25DRAFT_1800128, partial [Artomyces pyxidatus]